MVDYHNPDVSYKAKSGLHVPVRRLAAGACGTEATGGDIVALSRALRASTSATPCATPAAVEAVPFVKISEPTVEMVFSVNDSPFAGREGKFVTSRQIRERLMRELLRDVSLRVEETDSSRRLPGAGPGRDAPGHPGGEHAPGGLRAPGGPARGCCSRPSTGSSASPLKSWSSTSPRTPLGAVMEKMGSRKAEMTHMAPVGSRVRLEFLIPSRGLFGYRSEFLTDTRGEGIMNTVFHGYEPYKGDIARRNTGSLVAFETGEAVTYGLYNAQERGTLFITPGTPVYAGMVVGYSPKSQDLDVNVCKKEARDQYAGLGQRRGAAPDPSHHPEPGCQLGVPERR